MKILSFKTTLNILLLCLLLDKADCETTLSNTPATETPTPPNVDSVTVVTQNETSITLGWKKVNNISTYILKYDGSDKEIDASSQGESIEQVVSPLTAARRYSFTLITKLDTVTSTGFIVNASTAPPNVNNVTVVTQNETSISLGWKKVNNIATYILKYDDSNEEIDASSKGESIEQVVSPLPAARRYSFTLITKFGDITSTGSIVNASTAPHSVRIVNVTTQTETSITLRWANVDNISAYILRYQDGTSEEKEKHINASPQAVEYEVTDLTAGMTYCFTLVAVFETVKSAEVTFNASTAPPNVDNVTVVTQNETSISLGWKKVNNISTYILKYDGSDKEIDASSKGESIEQVVSPLPAARRYSFTLITKFGDITSTGSIVNASTAPHSVRIVNATTQTETSITLRWANVDNISAYILRYQDGTSEEKEKHINASPQAVEYEVTDLTAGTTYCFTLVAVFETVKSAEVTFNASTAPPNVDNVNVVTQNETSITLGWKKVNNISTYILKYDGSDKEIDASSQGESVQDVVSPLTAARRYSFTLITKFGDITSTGFSFNASTAPHSVTNVTQLKQNETSVTLTWKKVDNISTYILQNTNNGIYIVIDRPPPDESVTRVVHHLNAGTKYSFTLLSVFDGVNSTAYSFTAVTIPESVTNVTVLNRNDSSITLRWDKFNMIPTYYLRYNHNGVDTQKNISETTGETSVEYVVSPLNAATRYNFILLTVFEGFTSNTGYELTVVTAPHSVRTVNATTQTETSITLRWANVDNISAYILRYQDGTSEEKEKHINASQQAVEYEVTDLTAGTKYSFTLVAVFETVKSAELSFTAVTAPLNVNHVTVVNQTETNITLMWDKINNIYNYTLLYGDSTVNNKINESSQSVTHLVSSLAPGKNHTFTLFTVFETVKSSGYTFTAATVPPKVLEVKVMERSVTSVTLAWETADKTWGYLVEHNGINVPVTSDGSLNVVSHTVKPLKPGTMYEFKVITSFSKLYSTPYSVVTVTAINCSTVNWHITDSSIQGTVEGLFTNATASNHSQIHVSPGGSNVLFTGLYPGETYEIYLEYETKPEPLPQCRHSLTIRPSAVLNPRCEYWAGGYSVYIAWDKPVGVLTAVEVNVKDSLRIQKNEQHVIIDGFQPAKTYEVTLTSLSGNIRSSYPSVFPCYTDPRGVIAGSVFAVLLFGLLVCAALFIFFRRPDIISRKKTFISGSRLSNAKSNAISVAEFPDHFHQLNVDDKRGFSEEYEALIPVGKDQPHVTALLPENKAKNRFTNVLPYDWCRVKLSTSNQNGTSDYINASYMPGYKTNKQYIAAQGPLPSTVSDFWRMIWEQRVKGIVMVTNCVEGGRTKCEQYWPADSNPCRYGELLVNVQTEQKEPSWTLREFKVKHRNTSEERTVKHFHFTAWPDHNVPDCTEVLIQFRGLVRQHMETEGVKTPTVVHCSAGVGRTGTLIALDVLLQQLDKERKVGINAFVHQMRLSRPLMVQTESQYVFLHQCIMDCLRTKDKTDENIYENVDMIYVNATALRELH